MQFSDPGSKLQSAPTIPVPTITIGSDFDGANANGIAYRDKFTGPYAHITVNGSATTCLRRIHALSRRGARGRSLRVRRKRELYAELSLGRGDTPITMRVRGDNPTRKARYEAMITCVEQPLDRGSNSGAFLGFFDSASATKRCARSWKRLPVRCGRRVSQEEIAEVVGVTRNWYCRLESGEAVRTSVQLVDRLARVLASTPEERTALFHLAIPELTRQMHRKAPCAIKLTLAADFYAIPVWHCCHATRNAYTRGRRARHTHLIRLTEAN